ncbi:CIC11C00000002043 [Sungouiella intermedia]|uniref:Pre-mRNA-processing protein 45 n=1 Tax=Sungouiella intermedia TaxID=45354 RepID=A0A1L0BKD5_9ASCO|nr:CIC11C00000002043 [[Candida] intermedia]
MISSLLPKPKHATISTIAVVLPKAKTASTALLPNIQNVPNIVNVASLDASNPHEYSKAVVDVSGNKAASQTSYEDSIPLKERYPNLKHHFPRYTLQTCPDDSLQQCLDETRKVVNMLIAHAEGIEEKKDDVDVVELSTGGLSDEGRGRTVEIRNYQEDPMLPPKFKLRKNRHKNPSPPPPILKAAPAEKITKEIKDKWKIPSAVSNWKNNQGFAISLGKRVVAASGGSLGAESSINVEKFGQLSQALEQADRQAREDISIRNEQRKLAAIREQEEKQKKLKSLVEKSREATGSRQYSGKRRGSETYDARKRSRK